MAYLVTSLSRGKASSNYEPLDQNDGGQRSESTTLDGHGHGPDLWSYKHDRAKKRQMFLKSYQLQSLSTRVAQSSTTWKFKSMVSTMRRSIVSLFKNGCDGESAIFVASPVKVVRGWL
ncbi:hypothetical protein ACFE04_029949 [Oxalis oulophora]